MPETRRQYLPLAVLALMLLASCGFAGASAQGSEDPGPALPDFRLPVLGGGELGPADLKGKVVLYEFWATWCTPCHVQAEILKNLHDEATKLGVAFVGISSGEPAEVVRAYVEKRPFSYPVLLDVEDSLSGPLGIVALPTLIVADREGKVVWRWTGLADSATLRDAFAAAGAKGIEASR